MRNQYKLLVEQTLLLENINAFIDDPILLKTLINEIIHNTKIHPYIKEGLDLTNVKKEDFVSDVTQDSISKLKSSTRIEYPNDTNLFTVFLKISKDITKKLLTNKEVIQKIKQLNPDIEPDTIVKIVYALLTINDANISKTARDFMVRPNKKSAKISMSSKDYLDGLLSQSV